MWRVIQLSFRAEPAWTAISSANRSAFWILISAVIPCLALGIAVEAYGMMRWGVVQGALGMTAPVSQEVALRYAALQAGAGLVLVFVGSQMAVWICDGFHFQTTYRRCFTLVAYSVCGIFLVRMMDAFPVVHTWVAWAVGALLCVKILYHGIGLVLEPDQTKGFGLYILFSIFLVLLSGAAHFFETFVFLKRFLR